MCLHMGVEMIVRFALTLLALGTVSACTEPLPLTGVTNLTAEDSEYGLDIYAARRASDSTVPAVRGNHIVEIRTFDEVGSEDQTVAEMAGAECLIQTDGGSAVVTSPAGVRVNVYGLRTPPMDVQCIKEGFSDATVILPPFNLTKARRLQSAAAAPGLIGLVALTVVAGVNAASDETEHDFHYESKRIIMKKGSGSDALPEPARLQPVSEDTDLVPSTADEPGVGTETPPSS